MPKKRILLYLLYALPALALLTWLYASFAPYSYQTKFTHNLPKYLLALYLVLDFKSFLGRLNPGQKMHAHLRKESLQQTVEVRRGWQQAAVILRAILGTFFLGWALALWRLSDFPDWGWIAILGLLGLGWWVGMVRYIISSPNRIALTSDALHSYIWRYRNIPWNSLSEIIEKPDWVTFRREGKPDHDIDYDDLRISPLVFLSYVKEHAQQHHVPYNNLSQEFNPHV